MLLAQDVHAGPQRGEASFVIARKGPNGPIARRLVLKGTLLIRQRKKRKRWRFCTHSACFLRTIRLTLLYVSA